MLGDALRAHAQPQIVFLAHIDSDDADMNERASREPALEHDRLAKTTAQPPGGFEQRPVIERRIQNDDCGQQTERSNVRHDAMLHAYAMERRTVESRSVNAVGYDPATFELEIEFRNGRTYRYQQVPAAAYRLLLQAPSIGEFVNKQIKPRFEAREL